MTSDISESRPESLTDLLADLSPIAGFWRRFAAWSIDSILLGIAGQILGWAFSTYWFQIGPLGRLVGFAVILAYFGVMNSRLANGQTLGKRWLGIAVRGKDNQPISLGRSLVRISILAIPSILNGWNLPILQNMAAMWLASVIIFGVGGAIFYTMVFNRKTRQGLHDMICGTYVVYAERQVVQFPHTAPIHRIVSVGVIVLVAVAVTVSSVVAPRFLAGTSFGSILDSTNDLFQVLQTDDRFFSVGVSDNVVGLVEGERTRYLQIQVWVKGKTNEEERTKIMNDVASVVLDSATNLDQYDLLRISVMSAYDLGIASGYTTHSDGQPIDIWRERVEPLERL